MSCRAAFGNVAEPPVLRRPTRIILETSRVIDVPLRIIVPSVVRHERSEVSVSESCGDE